MNDFKLLSEFIRIFSRCVFVGLLFDQICNDHFSAKPGALDQFEGTNKWSLPGFEPGSPL